jgi:co-chaperonin GroES (HSP10)
MSSINVEKTQEEAAKAKLLPDPKGFRILCAVPHVEEEYDGGIIKAEDTKRVEEQTTVVLFVIKMGDLCYKDEARFPTGPWCKEGDFVLTRPYSGTRVVIHGREFRKGTSIPYLSHPLAVASIATLVLICLHIVSRKLSP